MDNRVCKKYFTSNSIFDYTNNGLGDCPKEQRGSHTKMVQSRIINDNLFYFEKMCQSKFVLCPVGDAMWSFKFYEILMCNTIPIVESWHHTYRTREESSLDYKYVLLNYIETKY